jgi:hypothetical protein
MLLKTIPDRDQPILSWQISISASAGDLNDNENWVGGADNAEWGFDEAYDVPEPPHAQENYISLYFPHDNWVDEFDRFASDVVPENGWLDQMIEWTFIVETDQEDAEVALEFDPVHLPGEANELVLEDPEGDRWANLLADPVYTYNSEGGGSREFRLFFGSVLSVDVTSPDGGEIWRAGDRAVITWECNAPDVILRSSVWLTTDGAHWDSIGATEDQDFDFEYEVPDLYSPYCKVRVVCYGEEDASGRGQSRDFFGISPVESSWELAPGWSLISLPLVPDDPAIDAVLADDINGYYWVFGYSRETGFELADELADAAGYWLALFNQTTIDVAGTANMDPAVRPLDEGWNILGCPYPWETPLDSLFIISGQNRYTMEQAGDMGLIVPILSTFQAPPPGDPARYDYSTLFSPWFGYWFYAYQPDLTLEYHPVLPVGDQARDDVADGTPESWSLTVVAGRDGALDRITRLGVDTSASDGFDARFDFPEPPAPPSGNYVAAYFPHDDWNRIIGRKYNRDIRSRLEPGNTYDWLLTVETGDSADVILNWPDISETAPEEFSFTLTDLASGRQLNMMDEADFRFRCDRRCEFRITARQTEGVGAEIRGTIPDEFYLAQNHPNPFNSSTSIAFGLPIPANARIVVCDLAGRQIATLMAGFAPAGNHQFRWNAAKYPAGVYLLQLAAGNFRTTRKMLLIK